MFIDLCVGINHISPEISAVRVQPSSFLKLGNVQITWFRRYIFDLFILIPHLFGVL